MMQYLNNLSSCSICWQTPRETIIYQSS